MNNAKDLGKVLDERKICSMFRNNDFGFDGFVAEPTLTSRNQTFPNTYERIFELNNCVKGFIALAGGFKTLEEFLPFLLGRNKTDIGNRSLC